MQTITNVVSGLRSCSQMTGETHCSVCPYRNIEDCDMTLTKEAVEYLLTLRDIQDRISPNDFDWLIDQLRTHRLLEEN